jgi:hypothetical protein
MQMIMGCHEKAWPSQLAANGAQDLLSAGVAITKDLESPVTSQEWLVLGLSTGF